MIRVICNLSLETFMKEAEPLLLKKETCNNLMLGILNRYVELRQSAIVSEGNYGIVYDGNEPIDAIMQTPPKNWIFADVENTPETAMHEVANQLKKDGYDVPGVIGPNKGVEAFVAHWARETSNVPKLHMKQLIYQLDDVYPAPSSSGYLEKASEQHEPLIAKWLFQFGKETVEEITREKAKEMAASFVDAGSAYVWLVDDTPVSMLNRSRETKNGATVNAVYTPDDHKRKGYATSAIAALSQLLLDEGFRFCSLYTDLLNPTSNHIYKRIGYYEVGTSIVYTF